MLGERVCLRIALVLLVAMFASALVACGGGKFDPAYQAGPLACDGHGKKSYHYTVNVVEEQVAVPPATPDPNTPPAMASWDIQGAVEGGDRVGSIDAIQHNEVTGGSGDVEVIFLENGDSFFNIGEGWRAASDTGSVNLAFQPLNICNALAQDADTTKLGPSVAETVNGIPSLKFNFQDLPSAFTANLPDLGGGGDAGNFIKTISGTVWVAERGNLITKLELTGSGAYTDGLKAIELDLKFEVSELDTEVSVQAPI